MVLIQVNEVVVEVHVLCDRGTNVSNELLNRSEETCLCIGAVCTIIVWLDVVLMNITQQGVENTSSSIEVATCNTLIRLHVDTTHTAFVLLNLCSTEGIEQLILNHRPLDRVRAFLVEITDVLTLDFFHWTPFHLNHSVVNVTIVVLNLHTALEDLTRLVSL